jgi:flagellar motility protein MotE (MotC chaperone)
MLEKIRILPILIISASLLFGLKIEDIWRNAGNFDFTPAIAQTENPPLAEKQTTENKVAPDKAGNQKLAAKQPEAATTPMTANTKPIDVNNLTPSELQLLQSLAKRRDEINSKSEEMGMREAILNATEKRIDGKIIELKTLEKRVQKLIAVHDEEADKRMKSLVKVYESMKPKDAARIFERLEMDILIDVTVRMKEVKMAAVLAKMESEKARELTVRLANLRKFPENGG